MLGIHLVFPGGFFEVIVKIGLVNVLPARPESQDSHQKVYYTYEPWWVETKTIWNVFFN